MLRRCWSRDRCSLPTYGRSTRGCERSPRVRDSRSRPIPKILAQWEYWKDSGDEARERSNVRQVTEHRRRDEQTFFKEEKIDSRWINVGWTRDPRRHFPVTPATVRLYHTGTLSLLHYSLPHFTPMSPSTLEGDSPVWPLFQTVLGVSICHRRPSPCLISAVHCPSYAGLHFWLRPRQARHP